MRHRHRPFACVVSPPRLKGWMWSISHWPCRYIASRRVRAVTVTDLDGPSQRAGEEPLADADVDDAARPVEDDALDVGLMEIRHELSRGDHRAVSQLAHPRERSIPRQHGEQGPRMDCVRVHRCG